MLMCSFVVIIASVYLLKGVIRSKGKYHEVLNFIGGDVETTEKLLLELLMLENNGSRFAVISLLSLSLFVMFKEINKQLCDFAISYKLRNVEFAIDGIDKKFLVGKK